MQQFHLYSKLLLFHTKLTVSIAFRVKSKVYIFMSNALFSIKSQPIDRRLATLLENV